MIYPYNYAYVNPVAGIGGVDERWETDYWFAGSREALSRVPAGAGLECFLVPGSVTCGGAQTGPFEDERGTDVAAEWQGDDGAWAIVRRHAGNRPLAGCEQAGDVSRWLRGESVTMAYVLRC